MCNIFIAYISYIWYSLNNRYNFFHVESSFYCNYILLSDNDCCLIVETINEGFAQFFEQWFISDTAAPHRFITFEKHGIIIKPEQFN